MKTICILFHFLHTNNEIESWNTWKLHRCWYHSKINKTQIFTMPKFVFSSVFFSAIFLPNFPTDTSALSLIIANTNVAIKWARFSWHARHLNASIEYALSAEMSCKSRHAFVGWLCRTLRRNLKRSAFMINNVRFLPLVILALMFTTRTACIVRLFGGKSSLLFCAKEWVDRKVVLFGKKHIYYKKSCFS